MRIIFLNCWHGKVKDKFLCFFDSYYSSTDGWLLQELQPKLFRLLQKKLVDFTGSYLTEGRRDKEGYIYGQALFIRKQYPLGISQKVDLYRNNYYDAGFMQMATIKMGSRSLLLANIHGKVKPGHKHDTPARISQSHRILEAVKDGGKYQIVGGDFNLHPNTRSIKLFTKAGYRNLIADYDIQDTRGEVNRRRFSPDQVQYFADYIFTTPAVKINHFNVPKVEISDHLPLILDFELA